MINSRQKGAAGEREVATILREELKLEIHRNWQQQAAEGGADLLACQAGRSRSSGVRTYL